MNCSTPGFPVHHQLPNSNSRPSSQWCHPAIYLILCRPLLLLPPILPSIRVFSNESALRMRWPKYWHGPRPLSSFHRHGPGMKELGLVILTCFVLSLAELTEKNIKVLIVFERSLRRHKAFCSWAQRIIHKVNHWHLFKDCCKRLFQGKHAGRSLRSWEGLLSEAHLWEKHLWQRSLLNLGLRNN